MKDFKVSVYPVEVQTYPNPYSTSHAEKESKEPVHINVETGTYKRWKTTRYDLPSLVILKKD